MQPPLRMQPPRSKMVIKLTQQWHIAVDAVNSADKNSTNQKCLVLRAPPRRLCIISRCSTTTQPLSFLGMIYKPGTLLWLHKICPGYKIKVLNLSPVDTRIKMESERWAPVLHVFPCTYLELTNFCACALCLRAKATVACCVPRIGCAVMCFLTSTVSAFCLLCVTVGWKKRNIK